MGSASAVSVLPRDQCCRGTKGRSSIRPQITLLAVSRYWAISRHWSCHANRPLAQISHNVLIRRSPSDHPVCDCVCWLEGAAASGGGRECNALGGAGGGGGVEHAVGVAVAAAGHDGRRGRRGGCDGVDEALWRGRLREDEAGLCVRTRVRACECVNICLWACRRARTCIGGREGEGTEEAGERRREGKSGGR